MTSSCDVIVVGGRCAGAATAMLLARSGLHVLLAERGRYGTDTLSTHALMRPGVVQLNRWNVLPAVMRAGTPPVRKAAFHYGSEVVSFPIKPRDGVDALYAPRRSLLDRLLVDAAREAGVDVQHEVRLADVLRAPDGRVNGALLVEASGQARTVTAGLLVGADGLYSSVARLVGATTYRFGQHAAGVVYGYWAGLEVDEYRWCFGPGVATGVIPTNDGFTCVFAGTSSARFLQEIRRDVQAGYHKVIEECSPELAASVASAHRVEPLRGFPGVIGYFRQSVGPGWALVGDAGYFKDPLTAHGITDAFRDAELLARAVSAGSDHALAGYQAARDTAASAIFDVTDDIASFDWDMERLKGLHRVLNEEMAREGRAMAAFDAPPGAGVEGQAARGPAWGTGAAPAG